MGFVFVKLIEGDIVSSNGGLVFRKLSTEPAVLEGIQIDLSALGLSAGTYAITVTATSEGLDESSASNSVAYTV